MFATFRRFWVAINKKGKEAYVEPLIEGRGYRFTVKVGAPANVGAAKAGTKLSRGANFRCLVSGTPMAGDYIKSEGKAGRMPARLMAIVAEGDRGRVYLAPTSEHEQTARTAIPEWQPELKMPNDRRWFSPPIYGLLTYGDLFTPRQLVALTTFSDLVQQARERVQHNTVAAGLTDHNKPLHNGGTCATVYAEAVEVYLAFALSKASTRNCTQTAWYTDRESTMAGFSRQAIPMTWDFAEVNPLLKGTGSIAATASWVAEVLDGSLATGGPVSHATQMDAAQAKLGPSPVISTDPPYYDNIGYADLSDFFYVWLRRSLKPVLPELFATLAVPKAAELVATPYRHGSRDAAETFFLGGMTLAMRRFQEQAHPGFPITIYYAFKQSERKADAGIVSTGWETFLDAVIRSGLAITGTWPMRTEQPHGLRVIDANALASSIVLVCRQRPGNASAATRREFLNTLRSELPHTLRLLQAGNIAPVDFAQAAIGPGMAVFTRYAKVVDAEGKSLPVREALELINRTLDEVIAEQEGDFDSDSRWAVAWFEQHGFDEGEYGIAETLSKAKNTSVAGLVEAGILASKGGKVRLLKPDQLPGDWNPTTDTRLTAWEMVHHLVRVLEADGESAAAELAARLGAKAEVARELCYRLYMLCERKKRAAEALSYNSLVQSWPEITRLAREELNHEAEQTSLFATEDG